jgi:hypothetical protein
MFTVRKPVYIEYVGSQAAVIVENWSPRAWNFWVLSDKEQAWLSETKTY